MARLTHPNRRLLAVTGALALAARALALALATHKPARATFPGANGKIAYEDLDHEAEYSDIIAVDPNGSGRENLTPGRVDGNDCEGANWDRFWDGDPGWSPDGSRIAFTRARQYYEPFGSGGCAGGVEDDEIYVMAPDGRGKQRLTNNAVQDGSPDWSPDGKKIAFVRGPYGKQDIYVMDADGGGKKNLTDSPGADDSLVPGAWSPDGSKIAFTRDPDGEGGIYSSDVYVANAAGDGVRRLTRSPASDHSPSWSPDGSRIAFVSDRTGNGDLFVINADGDGARRLTDGPERDGSPAWSPVGRKITFVKNVSPSNSDIFVVNSDGSGATNLTNTPAGSASECEADFDDCSFDEEPTWSPDGKKIAFKTQIGQYDSDELSVMNANGTGVRVISSAWVLRGLDWQPLGER